MEAFSENNLQKNFSPEKKEDEKRTTSEALRKKVEKMLSLFCSNFAIEGEKNLGQLRKIQEENPDASFVVTGSHLSNLDAPSAIKALGEDFDLQIAVTASNFGFTPQELLFRAAGRNNFSGLDYKKSKDGPQRDVFNPQNFVDIEEKMKEGKTPWIALHPFSFGKGMLDARVGPIYLAQKTKSYLLPTALELKGGGSISHEGVVELAKGTVKKSELIFHIGEPIVLEPIDVSIIEQVLEKRKQKLEVSSSERTQFLEVSTRLREQAEKVGWIVSEMLPQSMRGEYKKEV